MQPAQKIVSIHQPCYLPWLGYLHKVLYSDVFIMHDQVEFSKHVFTSRVLIRKPESKTETIYLSVPLKKHSDYIQIKDLAVDSSQKWAVKHLNLIRAAYQKSPHFKEYFPVVNELLMKAGGMNSFVEVSSSILKGILKLFGHSGEYLLSSSLPVTGVRSQYNVNLVSYAQGTVYLSGTGARDYQTDAEYAEKGIRLVYQDVYNFIQNHPYPTFDGTFFNGLSILDPLFNIGVDGTKNLLDSYELSAHAFQQTK